MLKFRCLFVPLGVDSTPLGQRKSLEILPAIGSALGGMFNLFGQESANKANLEAVEKTNQMNYQIAKETNQMSQAQFIENMKWLREQYYDKEQVKRAVEAARLAGLNPALALGQVQPIGSVGQASSTQFHAAHMEAGHVDPLQIGDGISESIGHSVDAFYNNQLRQAQAENVGVDSQIKRAQAMTEFASRVADIRSKYADIEAKLAQKGVSEATRAKLMAEKDKIDGEINLFWSTFDDQIKASKYGNRLLNAQADEADSRTALNKIEAQFKPMLMQSNIRLSQSHSSQLLALASDLWESAKTRYKYRHEVMPLEEIQRKLANGISSIVFSGSKSYEDFIKNNDMADYRNFIKTFGELLFRLAK